METVVFTYFFERGDEQLELEVEACVVDGFGSPKLVSYESMVLNGEELAESEIEDIVEEISEAVLEEEAIRTFQLESEEGIEEDDITRELREQLGHKVA